MVWFCGVQPTSSCKTKLSHPHKTWLIFCETYKRLEFCWMQLWSLQQVKRSLVVSNTKRTRVWACWCLISGANRRGGFLCTYYTISQRSSIVQLVWIQFLKVHPSSNLFLDSISQGASNFFRFQLSSIVRYFQIRFYFFKKKNILWKILFGRNWSFSIKIQ